jgi:hypothetical protein
MRMGGCPLLTVGAWGHKTSIDLDTAQGPLPRLSTPTCKPTAATLAFRARLCYLHTIMILLAMAPTFAGFGHVSGLRLFIAVHLLLNTPYLRHCAPSLP